MPRAPVAKTYSRKSSYKKNSTDAFNALLAKNLKQRQIFNQKILQIPELPAIDENHHLLADSFENFTAINDTFDKLLKTSQSDLVLNKNEISKADLCYTASQNCKNVSTEKQESTLDKSVIHSLCIEKDSLNQKTDEDFNMLKNYVDDSNQQVHVNGENQSIERSFEPIFSKNFQEANKKIISSTPAVVVNTHLEYTSSINELSPISPKSEKEEPYEEIHTWNFKPPTEFEPYVTTTPRINYKSRHRFKKHRKNKIVNKKQLKTFGRIAKNYIANDDKLNMDPKVLVNNSVDIIGISSSIQLGFSTKQDLSNVKEDTIASPKGPLRYNLRKRTVPITASKSTKFKKNEIFGSANNSKSKSHNSSNEWTKGTSISHNTESSSDGSNYKIKTEESSETHENVDEMHQKEDIFSTTKNLEDSYKRLPLHENTFYSNSCVDEIHTSETHTSLSEKNTRGLQEESESRVNDSLLGKATVDKISVAKKDINSYMPNYVEEVKYTYNNTRWTIHLTSDFSCLKEDELTDKSSIVGFSQKNARRLHSFNEGNHFKSFIRKHDLVRNCSTPKTVPKRALSKNQCYDSALQNEQHSEYSATELNSTTDKQILIAAQSPKELQGNQGSSSCESFHLSSNCNRLSNRVKVYNPMNVSASTNSDDNEISRDSDEELLRDEIGPMALFSDDEHFEINLKEEYSKLNITDLNMSYEETPISKKSAIDTEVCNATRKDSETSILTERSEINVTQPSMSSLDDDIEASHVVNNSSRNVEASDIVSTTQSSNETNDFINGSNEESVFFEYIPSKQNHPYADEEHSYSMTKLESFTNSSESLNNLIINGVKVSDESEVIVISDQEDSINDQAKDNPNNRMSNSKVDTIDISSDEEVENMNYSENSLHHSIDAAENSLCNKSNIFTISTKNVNKFEESLLENKANQNTATETVLTVPKPLFLKTGKPWRRSLLQMRRNSLLNSSTFSCIRHEGSCYSSANCVDCKTNKPSNQGKLGRNIFIKSALSTIRQSINTSLLELSLAVDKTYGPNNIKDTLFQETIGESFHDIPRSNSIYEEESPHERARSIVLRKCGQENPIPFKECYSETTLRNCRKIGEGVYGEVFLYKNSEGTGTVMKVIPIEGDQLVNDEPQKKYSEIVSEIIIAMELSNLRLNIKNNTNGFSELRNVKCVQGRYPERLLDLWDLYNETHKSNNDSPEMFGENQLYIVLELGNGGLDMESFVFKNASEAYALFKQISFTLAIAEQALEFEHRDLHWGNVLISRTDKNKTLKYCLDGREFFVLSNGVEVSIIDFTLSRMKIDDAIIYNDISKDPDLFTATGEYQFEVYKLMQQKNNNEWEHFEAYTNVLWMHYVVDKMINALRYASPFTKTHKDALRQLMQLEKVILKYNSVYDLVNNEFLS